MAFHLSHAQRTAAARKAAAKRKAEHKQSGFAKESKAQRSANAKKAAATRKRKGIKPFGGLKYGHHSKHKITHKKPVKAKAAAAKVPKPEKPMSEIVGHTVHHTQYNRRTIGKHIKHRTQ